MNDSPTLHPPAMSTNFDEFPVDQILPQVCASLEAGRNVVLQAPPGSGKTTRVAPALLRQSWLKGSKILLLEPRRLAARAAAAYMARQLDEAVGETIGYHVRLDRKISRSTRIEIITEGLLIQRLISDPELREVGVIIFDEFHERSLAADTALAITLEIRQALRPDLRLVIMSATFQPDLIASHIGHADVHTAQSILYPVETVYLPRPSTAALHRQVASSVMRTLESERGSILVFLPGEGEIKQCCAALRNQALPDNVEIHPLYASLPRAQQDAAIAPPRGNTRKVVLATSVAESSLTIEGIRVVIDAGLMRVPRYSPRLGMARLETLPVTRDRADQRRGRAGRLAPGLCLRLWDEAADRQLKAESEPEILDTDLTATVLQCAEWGMTSAHELPWMTPPPAAAWQRAVGLLRTLEAIAEDAGRLRITLRGRAMARIPVHPRLAHMILEAADYGAVGRASFLAALISERSSHARLREFTDLGALAEFIECNPDSFPARSIRELAQQWGRGVSAAHRKHQWIDDGSLLAWAFPDRVARKRDNRGVYLLRSGQGAIIDIAEPLAAEDWLVAIELHDAGANTRIRLAAAIDEAQVHELFHSHFETTTLPHWDKRNETVAATERTRLGAITIKESPCLKPDPEQMAAAMLEGVRSKGIDQLPWSMAAQSLRERVTFLSRVLPNQGWPDLSDAALLATLEDWFKPACDGLTRWAHIQRLDMAGIILGYLARLGCDMRRLDKLAPTHIQVASGSRIRVNYETDQPCLKVRIQEVFGMLSTPKIAEGRVPVTMHLLSPAQRPVQVTQDLEGFWQSSYALVRKDMRGRYPRHYWPEDPAQAEPTRRVKPR
ncbi:MAG: ATP-dependent helicase HrpB [Kiritimatiellae bacterium]|nr:ATP-dependent helicase HrpB [Kiritimatiellia bacterium]